MIEHATHECFWIQVSSGWSTTSWPRGNPSLSWEEFYLNGGFPEHESWLGRGGSDGFNE